MPRWDLRPRKTKKQAPRRDWRAQIKAPSESTKDVQIQRYHDCCRIDQQIGFPGAAWAANANLAWHTARERERDREREGEGKRERERKRS